MLRSKLVLALSLSFAFAPRVHAQDDFATDAADVTKAIEDEAADAANATTATGDADLDTEPPPDSVIESEAVTPAAPRRPNAVEEPHREIVREEERPSSPPGQPIFDWKQHQGEREVAHPFAEKGLLRIDKDRVYYYRVDEATTNRAVDLHFGMMDPTNLSNPEDDGPDGYYDDNYNGAASTLFVNYEWQKWNIGIGRVGLRAGSGLFFSQGNGHFVHPNGLKPLEVFTFVAIPLNAGLVYRVQWWHRQLFVPYGEAGGSLWAMAETRDDGVKPKFGGAPAAYFAAGAAMNLTYFNALSRIALEREYGVHAVYLLAEYRRVQGLSSRFDLSANYVNGGLLMEF